MTQITTVASSEITLSEIALLKCHKSKDFKKWLDAYGHISNNPHKPIAKQKYEDAYYREHQTLSGCRKYLKKFPNGKYIAEAQSKIPILEAKKKFRDRVWDERIENIGYAINAIIFLSVLLYPVIAEGWSIGESFMAAGALLPLYYGIRSLTRKNDS